MDEREELLKKDRERERRREELRRKREEEVQRKKRLTITIGISVVALLIVGTIVGVQISKKQKADKAAEKARQEKLAKEKEQEEHTIEFLAVGDNIAHQAIRESGMQEDGVWNYDHVYQYVKEDVEAADLALVTQETVFVEDRNQVSGYPSFGTPPEFGDALVNTGFDVVAHATNHIMDKGTKSIEYTMDWWKDNHPETEILGIHESKEAAEKISVIKCKKLKLAMLNYTYGLNGIELPSDKQYLVDVFDEDKAREDIKKAKELADVVIAVMHVGVEYDMDVDEETQQWVDIFLEEGVDIVIGSHPHVVRTMETLTGEDGHKMLVYYSLGNFTSTQNDLPSLLGAMAKITIRKDMKTGEIQIPEHEFVPLLMYYDRENPAAAIYKLEDYPDDLIEKHSVYQANPGKFSKEYYETLFEEIKSKGNDEGI
ncbi:MAG: CapA family protein [Blautia sp.]|nr:CapA family protein [Blautia sp.]